MSLDRRTPTTTTDPGGIDDDDYATEVDIEIHALWDRSCCALSSVAGTNTITAVSTPTLDAYATGMRFLLIPANTNTGAVTLNVDSKGARAVVDADNAALGARALAAGREYQLVYDGTSFRVLQPVIADFFSCLAADFTGGNVNTAQPVFAAAQDTITLKANTWYEFEAEYFITRAAGTTSHTMGVLFGGTATFTSLAYLAQITNPTGNVLAAVQQIWAAAQTLLTLTAANTSATENLLIKLKGRIRTSAAGTLIPQFQYSAAPGDVPTIKTGSCFRIRPIGADTLASVGAWA